MISLVFFVLLSCLVVSFCHWLCLSCDYPNLVFIIYSYHTVMTDITRYKLVKSVHDLVELVTTTCELGIFRELKLLELDYLKLGRCYV